MRKIIISTVLIGTLLFTFTPSVQAKQKLFELPIPVWFSQAIKPFQSALAVLTGRVENHDSRIAELEKKVAELEERIKQLEGRLLNQSLSNGQLSIESGTSNTTFYTESQGNLNIGSQTVDEKIKLDLNCSTPNCQTELQLQPNN
jgi:TolA-binding protein